MDQNEANHFLTRVYRTQESKNVYIYIYIFFSYCTVTNLRLTRTYTFKREHPTLTRDFHLQDRSGSTNRTVRSRKRN